MKYRFFPGADRVMRHGQDCDRLGGGVGLSAEKVQGTRGDGQLRQGILECFF